MTNTQHPTPPRSTIITLAVLLAAVLVLFTLSRPASPADRHTRTQAAVERLLTEGWDYLAQNQTNLALQAADSALSQMTLRNESDFNLLRGQAYTLKAAALLESASYWEAEVAASAAIASTPDNTPAFVIRARVYEALGQVDQAKADYRTAITLASAAGNADLLDDANRRLDILNRLP